MKKLSFILLAGLLAVSLVACVSTETNETETGESTDWEHQVGNTVENEEGSFTLIARNDEIHTQKTGPMVLNITQVNASRGELVEDLSELMEADVINYIHIDFEAENTSEDTVFFYPSQAFIETNLVRH